VTNEHYPPAVAFQGNVKGNAVELFDIPTSGERRDSISVPVGGNGSLQEPDKWEERDEQARVPNASQG